MPRLSCLSTSADASSCSVTRRNSSSTPVIAASDATAEAASRCDDSSAECWAAAIAALMVPTFCAIRLPVSPDIAESLRTSCASTPKLRPVSPACAASIAALIASRLVWGRDVCDFGCHDLKLFDEPVEVLHLGVQRAIAAHRVAQRIEHATQFVAAAFEHAGKPVTTALHRCVERLLQPVDDACEALRQRGIRPLPSAAANSRYARSRRAIRRARVSRCRSRSSPPRHGEFPDGKASGGQPASRRRQARPRPMRLRYSISSCRRPITRPPQQAR